MIGGDIINKLYWIYISLFGNINIDAQFEAKPLNLNAFNSENNAYIQIDDIREKVYNNSIENDGGLYAKFKSKM